MKAYTDLEQSKKLAEILPLESADMRYGHIAPYEFSDRMYDGGYDKIPYPKDFLKLCADFCEEDIYDGGLLCWSLAALLELLPKKIEIVDNVYELSIYLYGIYYWNIINGNLCFESKDKDNLVDACYEAIVFFHEQKLL